MTERQTEEVTCPRCRGFGVQTCNCNGGDYCSRCGGSGEYTCRHCDGRGEVVVVVREKEKHV